MGKQRRAPSGRSAPAITVVYLLLTLAAAWCLVAGQVCEDFSVDTGVYW